MKKLSLALLLSFPSMGFGMYDHEKLFRQESISESYFERPNVAATGIITLSDPKYDQESTKKLFNIVARYYEDESTHYYPEIPVRELLVKNNADANAKNKNNSTPLEIAAACNRSAIGLNLVNTLLVYSAIPTRASLSSALNIYYSGNAAETSNIVKALVTSGANINEKDPQTGNTLLHDNLINVPSVLNVEQRQVLLTLLMNNANGSLKNNDQQSAEELWNKKSLRLPFTISGMSIALRKAKAKRSRVDRSGN